MIFVDSGAWFASVVPADVNHDAAREWLEADTEPLLTTDYIIDETLTLLKVRGYTASAAELGDMLFAGELADILLITESDFQQAWRTFRDFQDKDWSFTDCTQQGSHGSSWYKPGIFLRSPFSSIWIRCSGPVCQATIIRSPERQLFLPLPQRKLVVVISFFLLLFLSL